MDRDQDLYRYRAAVRSVHDGDTCTFDFDLGTRVHREKLRRCADRRPGGVRRHRAGRARHPWLSARPDRWPGDDRADPEGYAGDWDATSPRSAGGPRRANGSTSTTSWWLTVTPSTANT